MGLFKKNKNTETTNEFAQPQKISGGDLYENYKSLLAQKEIDLANIASKNRSTAITKMRSTIESQSLDIYWLFEMQVNYFVNTIKYEMEDMDLFQKIKMLLRVAFKNGEAGLYKVDNKYMVVGISKKEIDNFGDIKSVVLTPINHANIGFKSEHEFSILGSFSINEKEAENLAILKWGSAGISAWITIWKLCDIQHELLTMINVDKMSYIKKFIHKINDPSASYEELENYFDIYDPFIRVPMGVDLKNRIEVNEPHTKIQPNILVEYYKQVMGIYYAIYGRRTNNDFKKERSVTQEIGLTSDNYLTLEKDWIDEFKVFVYKCKNKFNLNINVIENDNVNIEAQEDYERIEGDNKNGTV